MRYYIKLDDKNRILEILKENTEYQGDCWKFIGNHSGSGYGYIEINRISYRVHRLSAYIFLGLDINNSELQTNHKNTCPNKDCWNPDHIYVGNQEDNMQDRHIKTQNTPYPCGHPRTPENTNVIIGTRGRCAICRRVYLKKQYQNRKARSKKINGGI